MSDGVKRNIRYLSRYQFRIILYYLAFGIAYGMFMELCLSDGDKSGWQNGLIFFRIFLVIALTTTQMSVVKSQLPFALSLSSCRSDLVKGHLVMTIEIIAETSILLAVGGWLASPGQGAIAFAGAVGKYIVLLLITSSMGILIGLMPSGMGAVLARIVMIIVFAIAIAVVTAIGAVISQEEKVSGLIMELTNGSGNTYVYVIAVVGVLAACILTVVSHVMVSRKIKRMEVHF